MGENRRDVFGVLDDAAALYDTTPHRVAVEVCGSGGMRLRECQIGQPDCVSDRLKFLSGVVARVTRDGITAKEEVAVSPVAALAHALRDKAAEKVAAAEGSVEHLRQSLAMAEARLADAVARRDRLRAVVAAEVAAAAPGASVSP